MRVALGWVLALIGAVWVLQGFDVSWAPQSGMTGDWRWVVGGVLACLAGVGLLIGSRLGRREP